MTEILLYVATGVTAGLASWFVLHRARVLLAAYRQRFDTQARQRLQEFYLFVDPAQLWSLNLALSMVVGAVLFMLTGALWVALPGAAPCLALPYILVHALRRRRLQRIDAQLPEFLLAMAGAITSGSGLQQAMRHIAAQTPAPLGQELGLMLRESRMGLSFDETLVNLGQRVSTESMSLWVSSLRIAAHTGGSLGPLLEELAATLRARLMLRGKIHALTSQGKLQAWIMAGLPGLLAMALTWLDPQSMALFWETPTGWAMIGLIGVLDTAGLLLIRRIIDINV
jgi:tight adherence protein B